MLAYIDSSLLASGYLTDEPRHDEVLSLLTGPVPLVTASLTVVEVTGALARAVRGGRSPSLDDLLALLARDTAEGGAVLLIAADQTNVEKRARALCATHALRALDALHLAVAELAARPLAHANEEVAFLTADERQAEVAWSLGFASRVDVL